MVRRVGAQISGADDASVTHAKGRASFAGYPGWTYKTAIVLATALWGIAFVVGKLALNDLTPGWILGLRFVAAGLILSAFLYKKLLHETSLAVLGMSLVLAIFDFLAFWVQTVGLQYTTPGINAFLTATYCVLVPFVWWAASRRRPTVFNVLAACVALAGIWFVAVSVDEAVLTIGYGEGLSLLCAVFFSVHIVLVTKFSAKADVLVLTAYSFLLEGLFGCMVGLGLESAEPLSRITLDTVLMLAYLVIFSTIICFGIQNVALAYIHPAQAALFLSLESVFGVIASMLWYGEVLTGRLVLGFVLIFAAVLISEYLPARLAAKQERPFKDT